MNLLLLLFNGSLIAGIYALAKLGGAGGVTPLGMLAWQLLFAAVVVGAVALASGHRPPLNAAALRYAAVAGVLGVSVPNLLTFSALAHVPAGFVGVVGALSPVFTYAIALALRVERWRAARMAGLALGLLGVLAMLRPSAALDAGVPLPWALLALGGPLLLAAGNLYRTLAWPRGLHPLAAASLLLALQSAVVVPLALATRQFAVPSLPNRSASAAELALAGAGVLAAAFYLTAFELQKRAGPVVVGQLGYVITVMSIVLGALLFGERPSWSTGVAVALVFAGIALVHRGGEAARRAPVGALRAAEGLR